jgi:hypothetical protein
VATRPGQPGGSRRIKSLAEVCRSEGVALPGPLSPGERRTIAQSGCQQFVAQIAASQVVPRSPAARAKPTGETKPTTAQSHESSTGSSSLIGSKGHGRN